MNFSSSLRTGTCDLDHLVLAGAKKTHTHTHIYIYNNNNNNNNNNTSCVG
jgi:hypothetical protein